MERTLQYIWKHRLFSEADFVTTEGSPVFVIDAGIPNTDAGPDFFNAKVRIGNTVWVGNIEIHNRSSDWSQHHHQQDKSYDTVVLHIVRRHDKEIFRTNGEPIPQAILPISEKIEKNIEWLLSRDTPVNCAERLSTVSSLHLSGLMSALLAERLERKTNDIFIRLRNNLKEWNEVFYQTLTRNFGFGVNSDAFERLAGSLPYKCILKHRNNPVQIEALFLGQAGLLEGEKGEKGEKGEIGEVRGIGEIVDSGEAVADDPYYQLLRREYNFLRNKYQLRPVESYLFKKLRIRPINFPHVRLAQLAAVWIKHDLLFSQILETDNVKTLRVFFNVEPSEYWLTHYRFHMVSDAKKKSVGKYATDIILINTVIPTLFAYGKQMNRPEYCERALRFLEELKPERNSIVSLFRQYGVCVKNAGDSQALIQLRREYCEKKKCLYCRIGFRVIGNS